MLKMSGIAALALVLCFSCASLGDPFVVLFSMPEAYTSTALTNAGIDAYKQTLLKDGDLSAIGKVRNFFSAALRYDPSNSTAQRYLMLVDDFQSSRVSSYIRTASALQKKPSRSEADEYGMQVAISSALQLDFFNEDARALQSGTGETRKALVDKYLEKVAEYKVELAKSPSAAKRERLLIDSFALVLKVRNIDTLNAEANRSHNSLKADISAIVEKYLSGLEALYAKGSFETAGSQIFLLRDLDSKIGRIFRSRIDAAEYSLYLHWAKKFEAQKDYDASQEKVLRAISIQRGPEALSLQKKLVDTKAKAEQGSSFGAGLKNLDGYIVRKEYSSAQRLLLALAKNATDPVQKKELDIRRNRIRENLSALYADAVRAYSEERFKDAIALFTTVLTLDSTYEDAPGYLEKAQAKQKVLDQY